MVATKRRRTAQTGGQGFPLRSGPWRGVIDALDPFENASQYLYDAQNCYIPDPQKGSAVMARPGWRCLNVGVPLGAGALRQCQCIYEHVQIDGTVIVFVIVGGKIYRWNGSVTAAVFTDVTPVTPTIKTSGWIFCTSLNGNLIVTDGVNRPWIGTNLASTPITGTNIAYNAANDPWSAFGQPTILGAAVFFIINQINSVAFRSRLAWSEATNPSIGYFQAGFDDTWDLQQTGSDPIFAIVGDNSGFTYFRSDSIGRVDGVVDKSFRASATHDSIATDIGAIGAGASVIQSPSGIWFIDQLGRIRQLPDGGVPLDTWKQMRQETDNALHGAFVNSGTNAFGAYYAGLDLVFLVAQANTGGTHPFSSMYVFNSSTGTYLGIWTLPTGDPPHMMATVRDQNGIATLLVAGATNNNDSTGGFVFALRQVTDGVWTDQTETGAVVAPTRSVTPRLVVDTDEEVRFDVVSVLAMSQEAMQLSYKTPRTTGTIATTVTPTASVDGSYRGAWGTRAIGREGRFTFTPSGTAPTAQWGLQAIAAQLIPVGLSRAAP